MQYPCGPVRHDNDLYHDSIQEGQRRKSKRRSAASFIATAPREPERLVFAHHLRKISHVLHQRFILLLVTSYVLAGFMPGPGLWIRSAGIAGVSLPMMMLGVLLFNAGLGVDLAELADIRRHPARPDLWPAGEPGNPDLLHCPGRAVAAHLAQP